MPGSAKTQRTSALGQFRKRARELLVNLRSEISSKEAVLRRLKEEETKLSALTGGRATYGARPAPRGGSGSVTARINWRTVLEQLLKRFRAANIRIVRGLKNKRPSEIFAAIARWTESGAVKRKERPAQPVAEGGLRITAPVRFGGVEIIDAQVEGVPDAIR